MNKHLEIEVKFPEIDVEQIQKSLKKLGALDLGERFLKEVIIQDKNGLWMQQHRRVRIRDNGKETFLTYKEGSGKGMSTVEYEIEVGDFDTALSLVTACDLQISRKQEKYRHSYRLGECLVEIDCWPGIPIYLEIEGPSIEHLKKCAKQLDLDWSDRYEKDALCFIGEWYGLDLHKVTEFTFDNYPTTLKKIF